MIVCQNTSRTGNGYYLLVLVVIVLTAQFTTCQRISIVDRLKALDKGLRQGLQRQKSESPTSSTSTTTSTLTTSLKENDDSLGGSTSSQQLAESVNSLAALRLGSKPLEQINQKTNQPELSMSPEEADGTSDVVRQLTDSFELGDEEDTVDTQVVESKEGNLELEDGTAERKRPLVKPTKYHYYPHNQHLYLLPECATQQVCNAVYTRFNYTQPLCACADRFQGPCSASIARNDYHTIEVGMKKITKTAGTKVVGRGFKSPTLVKTCEETKLIRECRSPQDWALLALQNVRTGKSQYLVICRCEQGELDGPMSHEQPAYARVPGIRVYGMMCNSGNATNNRNGRSDRSKRSSGNKVDFPWEKVVEFASTVNWE